MKTSVKYSGTPRSIKVGALDDVVLSIDPVEPAGSIVECQTVGPRQGCVDDDATVLAVH